jgi:hypothetical protein
MALSHPALVILPVLFTSTLSDAVYQHYCLMLFTSTTV